MYRESPERTLHCAQCGSSALTDETRFEPSAGYASVHFREVQDALTRELHACRVDRARICLECGHVALCVSPTTLGALKAKLGALRAVPAARAR